MRQGLSLLTCVEIVDASTSGPTLCHVALALRLPVRAPSAVCVAGLCVIMRPQDAETGWGLSAPLKAGDSWMALDATSWMHSPFVCGRTLCCLVRCHLTQPFSTVFLSHWSFTSQPRSPLCLHASYMADFTFTSLNEASIWEWESAK